MPKYETLADLVFFVECRLYGFGGGFRRYAFAIRSLFILFLHVHHVPYDFRVGAGRYGRLYQESDQRDDEAQRHILLADISHQHRTESAAGDSHHDIRRGFLGINAHTFQPQRENRREHDGHEEKG